MVSETFCLILWEIEYLAKFAGIVDLNQFNWRFYKHWFSSTKTTPRSVVALNGILTQAGNVISWRPAREQKLFLRKTKKFKSNLLGSKKFSYLKTLKNRSETPQHLPKIHKSAVPKNPEGGLFNPNQTKDALKQPIFFQLPIRFAIGPYF